MSSKSVLVVDDEPNIRKTIAGILGDEGYAVDTAGSAEEGLEKLKQGDFALLLLDVQLPGRDGIELLEDLAGEADLPHTIVMSGHATIDMAVQATKLGAHDFMEKPIDPERLLLTLRHALEIRELRAENRDLRAAGSSAGELLGQSEAMDELRHNIERAAPSHGRVLITGENGTGKELVARAIHFGSGRSDKPFIKVNCAAIPKDLIESELFGHERGAFTGATERRIGKIEQAEGGTLLLDEVGDMSLETQAKLLRVLESKELERVGGRETIPFDVRVVSATNKVLPEEISEGHFREDLYYRLAVIPIHVPPLRERLGDISLLVRRFSQLFMEESGRPARPFTDDAFELLRSYRWPGNVRELKNLVERVQIMTDGKEIAVPDVARFLGDLTSSGPGTGHPGTGPLRERVEQFEVDIIIDALRKFGGNVAETARHLSTDRANLHRKMKRFGIDPKDLPG